MDSLDEKRKGSVTEDVHADNVALKDVNPASAALAAAVASQKPSPWSKNMLKLYSIMAIGYLVSTMNGFGKFKSQCKACTLFAAPRSRLKSPTCFLLPPPLLTTPKTARSWEPSTP